MSPFADLWESSKQRLPIGRVHYGRQQQYDDTEPFELRALPSASSTFEKDTSYASDVVLVQTTSDADYSRRKKTWLPRWFVRHQKSRKWMAGWRFGAINCAVWASIVFIINFVVTIWASVHNKARGNLLYEGDCDRVDQLNTGVHLLINLLSTVLLSSSNYAMQCLSAPTRSDIDKAHARRVWLDIGVPSIHNLRRISKKRALLWALLGLSSLPLHLFYNSAVFSSIAVNNYFAMSVSESFFNSDECHNCGNLTTLNLKNFEQPIRHMWERAHNNELERLTNVDCLNAYSEMLQTKRRNVLLVASDDKMPPVNASLFGGTEIRALNPVAATIAATSQSAADIYDWMCSGLNQTMQTDADSCLNRIGEVKNKPNDWKVSAPIYNVSAMSGSYSIYSVGYTPLFPVDYCLSEIAEEHCKLQFVPAIAILVTILNLCKAILIFYVAFGTTSTEEPLLTMGDAVASFLEDEDPTTKDMCLLTVHEVKASKHHFPLGPREWKAPQYRWKDVTSLRRRITTVLMFSITVIGVGALYQYGISALPDSTSRSLASLAKLGYGSIDPRTIIYFNTSLTLIANILVANVAQPILSFLYFSYNGLFTCMLLGYEWSTYAHHRKGLRVSRAAAGSQRSTYFLQLPYRFALPLMALSGILHWLVSQSIFLVAIDVYDWDGTRGMYSNAWFFLDFEIQDGWKSCGYSPIAILNVVILGAFMVVGIIGFGFVPFKRGMNLVGSCSVAISAACHLRGSEEGDGYAAAVGKLRWGDVGVRGEEEVRHCSFSTQDVVSPSVGKLYAGEARRRNVGEGAGSTQ